jgi:serine/threonine protein kinase
MSGERFGPYRLDELIGHGGMGEVFRAYDTAKGRYVALKRLQPALAQEPEFRARFRRESTVAARLRDAHVIPIHDFGEIDGQLYIDMRLVEGIDLASLIAERGPLTPQRAVGIVVQIARALDSAHADGLVHRDVMPSNVLISEGADEGYYAYLVDFGIAHPAAAVRLTQTGFPLGTLEYMAPERFLHGAGDLRVDVYALGCLLYECLTGDTSFPGEGLPMQMYAHLATPPPKPSMRASDIPEQLDKVLAQAMAKDPNERYAAAGELAAAAHAAVNGDAASRTSSPASSTTASARRATPSPSTVVPASGGDLGSLATAAAYPSALPPTAGTSTEIRPFRARTGQRWLLNGAFIVILVLLASVVTARRAESPPKNIPAELPAVVERILIGHTDSVDAVATTQLNGRTVVISASADGTVRVWDLATGDPLGQPLSGFVPSYAPSLATALVDGRPVIVSPSSNYTVQPWDLATRSSVGRPLAGHTDSVLAVATTQLNGRSVIISGSADGTVRVWDLATGDPLGQPLGDVSAYVTSLATAQLDGQPVIIAGSTDRTVQAWDLTSGAPVGQAIAGAGERVAAAQLDDRPVIAAVGDTPRVWDLATGAPVGQPLRGHTDFVSAVSVAELDGRPLIVSGSVDRTLRLWDMATGNPISQPLTGHTDTVLAVATAELDGRPIIVSGSLDHTVRVWDLAAHVSS